MTFLQRDFARLHFSPAEKISSSTDEKVGFKRRQREIKKMLTVPAGSTKSQMIYQKELEKTKKASEKLHKEKEEQSRAEEAQKRKARKLKKKLGH